MSTLPRISALRSPILSPLLPTAHPPTTLPSIRLVTPPCHTTLCCTPRPRRYAARLEDGASVISWIFIAEMAVKLLGLGCTGYWSDGWNCLDGTIVSLSIVEIVLTAALAGMEGVNISFFRILCMLRMLRVLRILRLMKSWRVR